MKIKNIRSVVDNSYEYETQLNGSSSKKHIKNVLPIRASTFDGFEDGRYAGEVSSSKFEASEEYISQREHEYKFQNNHESEHDYDDESEHDSDDESDSESDKKNGQFIYSRQGKNSENDSITKESKRDEYHERFSLHENLDQDDDMSENDDAIEIEKIRNKLFANEDILNEGEIISSITEKRELEIRRAKHVRRQKLLWENILKVRVALQRPLDIINILPNESSMKKDEKLGSQLRTTLYNLISIQKSLLNSYTVGNITKNSILVEDVNEFDESKLDSIQNIQNNTEMEKNIDSMWNLVKHSYQRWKVLRDRSINSWSRKTQLTNTSSGLKSINADATDQVQRQLKQMHKLIRDTQIWRGSGKLLGKRKRIEDENKHFFYDTQIYDDRDFYQSLLSNLLQEASSNMKLSQNDGSKPAKRQRNDKPLTRDRTLKYVTIPELVGYMAPYPKKIPPSSRALFNNLFGRKRCEDTINEFEYMSEDENEENVVLVA